jgi:hypothetical protein
MFTNPCSALIVMAAPAAISLNDEHTLISPRRGPFKLLLNFGENGFAFFHGQWRLFAPHPMSLSGAENQHREKKMKQLLKLAAAPAAALLALALAATAMPASAAEYCRQDVTSGMRSCSFDTLAQCHAMSLGRGGDCYRDPFLADTGKALAYQPKVGHSKAAVRQENRQ